MRETFDGKRDWELLAHERREEDDWWSELHVHAEAGGRVKIWHAVEDQLDRIMPVNFGTMVRLSELFGTRRIDARKDESSDGCDTCGHGAFTSHRYVISGADLSRWEKAE